MQLSLGYKIEALIVKKSLCCPLQLIEKDVVAVNDIDVGEKVLSNKIQIIYLTLPLKN